MTANKPTDWKRVLVTVAIYAAAAWAAVEAMLTVVDRFGLPAWWGTLITALFVAGLPVTVFLVWRTAGAERHADAASIIGFIIERSGGYGLVALSTERTREALELVEDIRVS